MNTNLCVFNRNTPNNKSELTGSAVPSLRVKKISFFVSMVLIMEGVSFLSCIPYAAYFGEPLKPFLISALISFLSGLFLYSVSIKRFTAPSSTRESLDIIVFSWLALILAGALPYFFSQSLTSNFDILFETISGFTTTGSSILKTVELLPKSIIFWRSLTHWLGGIATIVMGVAIFPSLNISGHHLHSLKAMGEERDTCDFRTLIKRIFAIYCTLTAAQATLFYSGGIGLFKSLCYSFGTVSTGCFSPVNNGASALSLRIQAVMTIFMFLSGINYLMYYLLLKGEFRLIMKNEEIKAYVLFFMVTTLLAAGVVYLQKGGSPGSALSKGSLQAVALISSSGDPTEKGFPWPAAILPIVYVFIFVGGCAGSSSGGVKVSRFIILIKNLKLQFKNPTADANISNVRYNGSGMDDLTNLSALAYITAFGFVFMAGSLTLVFFLNDIQKTVFLTISALATSGHHQDLSGLPNAGKIILSLLMFIGKMEIYPFLVLFVPSFYRETPMGNVKGQSA